LSERSLKPSQRVPKEETEKALMVAREQVRSVGPYAGRARIFKGSRVDKDKNRRREDVRAKLEAMEATKREWQAVSTPFSSHHSFEKVTYTDSVVPFLTLCNRAKTRQRTSLSPDYLSNPPLSQPLVPFSSRPVIYISTCRKRIATALVAIYIICKAQAGRDEE